MQTGSSRIAKLRGHHLICLNFFKGEGYSKEFINNIYSVLEKRKVEIVEGPDDICTRCPYLKENKCSSEEYTDEMIVFQDEESLRLLKLGPGEIVDWNTISDKLAGVLEEWKARFCLDCGYRKVCFG